MPRLLIAFTDEENAEYESITFSMLKEGHSDRSIATHIGISSIKKYKTNLMRSGKITQAEIDKAREDRRIASKAQDKNRKEILLGLRNGESDKEIVKRLSFGLKRLDDIKRDLINEGLISHEEIQAARMARKEKEDSVLRKQLLHCLLAGESNAEILSYAPYGAKKFNILKNQLIEEGKINQKQIDEARARMHDLFYSQNTSAYIVSKARRVDVDEPNDEINQALVLEGLKQGFTIVEIVENNQNQNLSRHSVSRYKSQLIANGSITLQEIEDARFNRNEAYKKSLVLQGLRSGFTIAEIMASDTSGKLARATVRRYKNELLEEGSITDQEIDDAKFDRNERYKKELVLQGLREGFTNSEIVDSDESGNLSRVAVIKYKKQLIEEGSITVDEISSAQSARAARIKPEKSNIGPHDLEILELLDLGFNIEQVAAFLDLSDSYVSHRKSHIKLLHNLDDEYFELAESNKNANTKKRRSTIRKLLRFATDLSTCREVVESHIKFLNACLTLDLLDIRDIDLISRLIPFYTELMSFANIKLIAKCYTKLGNDRNALKFLSNCETCLDDNDSNKRVLVSHAIEAIQTKIDAETEPPREVNNSRSFLR